LYLRTRVGRRQVRGANEARARPTSEPSPKKMSERERGGDDSEVADAGTSEADGEEDGRGRRGEKRAADEKRARVKRGVRQINYQHKI
jgi:hypothetical protein